MSVSATARPVDVDDNSAGSRGVGAPGPENTIDRRVGGLRILVSTQASHFRAHITPLCTGCDAPWAWVRAYAESSTSVSPPVVM